MHLIVIKPHGKKAINRFSYDIGLAIKVCCEFIECQAGSSSKPLNCSFSSLKVDLIALHAQAGSALLSSPKYPCTMKGELSVGNTV